MNLAPHSDGNRIARFVQNIDPGVGHWLARRRYRYVVCAGGVQGVGCHNMHFRRPIMIVQLDVRVLAKELSQSGGDL